MGSAASRASRSVHQAKAAGATPGQMVKEFEGGGLQRPTVDPVDLAAGGVVGFGRSIVARAAKAGATSAVSAAKAVPAAGYTLSPGSQMRSGAGAVHSILRDGAEVGVMKVIPGGSKLRIDTIQGTGAGTVGAKEIRTLAKQLKGMYPGVKQITGWRTTGAAPMRPARGSLR